jgi:hypothetical protein
MLFEKLLCSQNGYYPQKEGKKSIFHHLFYRCNLPDVPSVIAIVPWR